MAFDPELYKSSTRQQWEDYAAGWSKWSPLLESWLGDATERMLDLAGVTSGSRVIDIAAGAGGQTIKAAKRVGASGSVLATDISPEILRHAEKAASAEGVAIQTRELDGEKLADLDAGSFDAAISRVGLIYFPDRATALKGIHHVLADGGRFATITYSTAAANPFFSIPVSIIRERAKLPAPAPGQPGPFSLADPDVLTSELTAAGFHDVTIDVMSAPVLVSSAAECTRFERESFGALHQMLSSLDPADQQGVWEEIETALGQFETDAGFVGPCELVVAGATK